MNTVTELNLSDDIKANLAAHVRFAKVKVINHCKVSSMLVVVVYLILGILCGFQKSLVLACSSSKQGEKTYSMFFNIQDSNGSVEKERIM